MKKKSRTYLTAWLLAGILAACHTTQKNNPSSPARNNNQEHFWNTLQSLCGKTFAGTVMAAPPNDTNFSNKTLLMQVRSCEPGKIRIPFIVGDNRSRTWVFTKNKEGISLKHDHRHRDGTEDSITQYGGHTSNSGTATAQYFPADQQTANLLPAAASNVWWVEVQAGKYFTYNLRRLGTDRLFSIRFDLSGELPAAEAPWGWKD